MVPERPLARPGRELLGRYDYPRSHRVFEVAAAAAFAVLAALHGRDLWRGLAAGVSGPAVAAAAVAAVAAYAAADVLSGLVHLAFDTLGSPATPLIGQKFVKPFRDHHDDPLAMTQGDALAVNGDNLFASLVVLGPLRLWVDVARHLVLGSFVTALVIGVVMTNQIHKWCHLPSAPRGAAWAQRRGLILTPEHHAVHHRPPHGTHHCITWGRLDRVVVVIAAGAGLVARRRRRRRVRSRTTTAVPTRARLRGRADGVW